MKQESDHGDGTALKTWNVSAEQPQIHRMRQLELSKVEGQVDKVLYIMPGWNRSGKTI